MVSVYPYLSSAHYQNLGPCDTHGKGVVLSAVISYISASKMSGMSRKLPPRLTAIKVRFQYVPDLQTDFLNVRVGVPAETGHQI